MLQILDTTRTALALFFLLYASWSDYKTREVSNRVWMLFAPPALALTLTELLLYESERMVSFGLSFALTTFFALILFYAGGFGGADAKALMCLALALPFYPESAFAPVSGRASPISQMIFPMTVFSNSVILVLVPVAGIILRNAYWRLRTGKKLFQGSQGNESIGKKLLVLITGYKMPIKKLKEKWHIYPLEDAETTGDTPPKRKLVVLPKDQGREATVGRLSAAIEEGKIEDPVWASPGLPMLILVTMGLVVALFIGDISWILVTMLAK